jgi:hypothetical protein
VFLAETGYPLLHAVEEPTMAENKPTDMRTLAAHDRDGLRITLLVRLDNISDCLMILFFLMERTTGK